MYELKSNMRALGGIGMDTLRVGRLFWAVLLVGWFSVWLHSGSVRAAEGTGRPNVLVILVDDLGFGDLSAYGATDLKSPHVDQLIADGMRFDHFYANCPVCSPTRAALLTGKYQDRVGVPGVIRTHVENNWGYLAPDCETLADVLGEAGYETAIIGKWHLGLESPNIPTERGFDHFKGYLGDMMDDYYDHRRHGINYMRDGTAEIDPAGHATDLFTEWSCEYLEEQANDKVNPFFLYLAYNAPHTPIQPPQDWLEKVQKREPGISERRAQLVALIEHLDDGIGRVMDCLRETGQAENTLVCFSSDNGGQLNVGANNGANRDGKQSVYEGGLRVPTAVVWPGKIEAGSQTDFRAMSMDLFPTILEAAGLEAKEDLDARSFLPTLQGKSQEQLRDQMFFSRREGGQRYGGKTIEAVIRGDWKLLQNSPFAPLELYNLKNDPLEQTEMSKKAPRIFDELSAALRKQIQYHGEVPWQKPGSIYP